MLSDFIALTESINNKLIKCQEMLKEVVLETDVIKALTYLESLNITETEHCLLFCASLKQNHKFVNKLMRKNRQKTLKRTYCNIKSNKFATFCNMNILTYLARFVTI